ncbi:hypothetical protein [Limnochorda pilosa]|uniref:Uncharacterized protein n=1 Tax=Limnochorda pilosa TaxID=1555112 RepID=A0A0K2SNY1_LIMPI|nr:hypothetical protein [Limnochorda pilosa]BAS28811.1 hypothetical protein LIP_2982 [Limnochorda pilosa]
MSACRQDALWARKGGAAGEELQLPQGLRLAARFDEPPQAPGLLADPPISRWIATAERNRRLLLEGGVEVAGLPLDRIRRSLREEGSAAPVPLAAGDPPVLVTGHQPILYHPGVWVKLFAGASAADAGGGRLLNLVVDSDVADLSVPVPALSSDPAAEPGEGPARPGVPELHRLQPAGLGPDELPLERRAAPDAGAWRAFLEQVRALLAPLAPQAAARLDRLAAVTPEPRESVAAFFSRVRRGWEEGASLPGPTGYRELPVSALSGTLAFRLWVVEWAENARFWREAYNEALRQYRILHRLRYPANPFPDLEETPEGVEIPFWSLPPPEGGDVEAGVPGGPQGSAGRRPVLACALGDRPHGAAGEAHGGRIILRSTGPEGVRTLAELPTGDPLGAARALAQAGVALRPKAIPLTLFARLFLGDLFIHGTGGARYETIGDFLLAARWPEAFGREVPRYAVCSATLRLEGAFRGHPLAELAARRERLEDLLRGVEHNPQRVVADLAGPLGEEAARAGMRPDPELTALAARKEELVRRIQSGGDRKALGQAIREVNGELAERLRPLAGHLARELAAARGAEAVLAERGCPFFLFEPEELWRLLEASSGEPGLPGGR